MMRIMAYIGLSYFIGLFFASFFYNDIIFLAGIIIFVTALLSAIIFKKKQIKLAVCVMAFSTGIIFYSLYSKNVYEKIAQFDNTNVIVSGTITDFEDYYGDNTGYTVNGKIGDISAKILCYADSTNCQIGDEIYLKGDVSIPKNNFEFNAYDYYKSNGIYLIMNRAENIKIVSNDAFSLTREIRKYREYIFSVFNEHLSTEEAAIISAMFLGDKSEISDVTLTKMYRSGIGHIMAVSGVHLTIVCSVLWFLILFLPISKRTAFIIMLFPIACFVILSGASNSVLRAAIMMILIYSASLFGRKPDLLNSLGISAIILTLSCPFAVRDPSLLLSITGVIAVGAISPYIIKLIREKHKVNYLLNAIITTTITSIIIFPMTFLFFDETSIISPITNLLIISLCTIVIVLALFITITGGISIIASPLLLICGFLCKIILAVTDLFGSLQISSVPLKYDFVLHIILISLVATVVSVIVIKSVKHRIIVAISMFSFCILAVGSYRFIPSKDISLAVLCDGKKACTIVVHDKKNASIIDINSDKDNVYLAEKYLRGNGISRVEMLLFAEEFFSSEAAYKEYFSIFEVGSVVIPAENSSSDYKSSFSENTFTYDENSGSKITLESLTINISAEQNVEIEVFDSKIAVISNDEILDGDYTSVIFDKKYNSEKHGKLSADFWLFTNENYLKNSQNETEKNIIIAKPIVMKISNENLRMEEIKYGFDFR